MPVIARFYGILIKMYFSEHGIAHFHAMYGEFNAVYDIDKIAMIEGDLPGRAQELVEEWIKLHQAELKEMWTTRKLKKLPGLE